MLQPPIVSRDTWLEARRTLLEEETALMRQQDAFNAPKGRNENGPHRNLIDWVKRHDEYAVVPPAGGCCA